MMTSADKVGGWVKKGQNHDDVILEWSLFSFIVFGYWVVQKKLLFCSMKNTKEVHMR